MRRYEYSDGFNFKKQRAQEWNREHKAGGFKCSHCKRFVVINDRMGTANRNHCNMCLWSKHVDELKGDRRATCHGGMEPIALTLKHEGYDRIGEIMLVHLCSACQKISISRIARDDPEYKVLAIFHQSFNLEGRARQRLSETGIDLLGPADKEEVDIQLFGKL